MITFVSYLTSEHSVNFLKKATEIKKEFFSSKISKIQPSYEYLENKKFEIIEAFFSSIALFHPDSRRILIVDQDVDQKRLKGPFEVRQELRKTNFFTLARFAAWRQFLLDPSQEKGPILFMDFDILVQDRLNSIFKGAEDFFISFNEATKSTVPYCHFNAGVIGIGAHSRLKAACFFDLLLFMIRSNKNPNLVDWWGDQVAIEAVFSPYLEEIFSKREIHLAREGLHVKFLEEMVYNRVVLSREINFFLKEAKILHFKGHKKKNMLSYWENHKAVLKNRAKSIVN